MKAIQGDSFSLDKINLAELERRTGISRARLRRLKQNSFQPMPHGNKGRKADYTVLTGYTSVLDNLLKQSITNSSVCLERLRELGYTGGQTAIKVYLSKHKDLIPAITYLTSDLQFDTVFMFFLFSILIYPIGEPSFVLVLVTPVFTYAHYNPLHDELQLCEVFKALRGLMHKNGDFR